MLHQLPTGMNWGMDAGSLIRTTQGTTVDSDTLLRMTQTRIWASLKKGYEYDYMPDNSDKFLRKSVLKRFNSTILYVDLVGSTQLATSLSDEKVAIIMTSFVQEMANIILAHTGMVLKFMGDAVIGYFVATDNPLLSADRAVSCGKSMLYIIKNGINPILTQYEYPELHVKVGMDYGTNIVVRYGQDPAKSHVDMLGRPMNMAAKIQSLAGSDQILVGEDVYTRLHPSTRVEFRPISWDNRTWLYHAEDGRRYGVYEYEDAMTG